MKLDITQILSGKIAKLEFPISLDPAEVGCADFFPEDTVMTEPIGGTVTVSDRGEYISVWVAPVAKCEIPCSRCLTPVVEEVDTEFERIIPSGGRFAVDEDLCDEEDILTVTEGHIDITNDICEEMALAIPDFVLCADDCPGLCPKCGKKLADGDCGCKKEKEIDPRMKIFEKLLKDTE